MYGRGPRYKIFVNEMQGDWGVLITHKKELIQ